MFIVISYHHVLNGAHLTGEFFLCIIWWTLKAITTCFHMVEKSSICIGMTSRDRLLAAINTLVCGTLMSMMVTHEVAVILSCP